jgi:hypothetical protein
MREPAISTQNAPRQPGAGIGKQAAHQIGQPPCRQGSAEKTRQRGLSVTVGYAVANVGHGQRDDVCARHTPSDPKDHQLA